MITAIVFIILFGPWILFDLYFLGMSLALIALQSRPLDIAAYLSTSNEDQEKLTIVIPVYNNSKTVLRSLVPRLHELRNPDGSFPVAITIIDSSTDGTQHKIADALNLNWQDSIGNVRVAKFHNLSLFHLANRQGGKGWAINKVFPFIATDYFAIVDSDWFLSFEDLVKATCYLRKHSEKSYAQLAWRAIERDLNFVEGVDQVSIEYRHQFENRVRIWQDFPVTIHGSAVVIRSQDFKNIGGFDDSVLSEDVDLSIKLMLQNRFGQGFADLLMQENPCDHLRQFFWQKSRWAEGRSQLLRRYAADIIRSPYFKLKQKIFWIYYLSYFGRCVTFSTVLALSLIGWVVSIPEILSIGFTIIGIVLLLRFWIHVVTAFLRTNKIGYIRISAPAIREIIAAYQGSPVYLQCS